jgi:hypothetical protein
MSSRERDEIFHNYLRVDAPRPGTAAATIGRRIGSFAWIADYTQEGHLEGLVIEENLPKDSRDLVDEEGRCLGCKLPYDDSTAHGYPVCMSTVTVTGDRGSDMAVPGPATEAC